MRHIPHNLRHRVGNTRDKLHGTYTDNEVGRSGSNEGSQATPCVTCLVK